MGGRQVAETAMRVEELAVILEHLPPDLPIHIAGKGELMEVPRYNPSHNPWVGNAVFVDVGEALRVKGRVRDRRTLDVRLEGLAS